MKNIILAFCILLANPVSSAYADDEARTFLESLDGKFRGRGIAVLPVSGNEERVSCQLENKFVDEANKLVISGRCATTQGKMEVSGELLISEEGNFEGVFLSPSNNVEIKESLVNYTDNALTVTTTTLNKKDDKTTKARQIVVLNEGEEGFSSVFELFDETKDTFTPLGTMEFKANN